MLLELFARVTSFHNWTGPHPVTHMETPMRTLQLRSCSREAKIRTLMLPEEDCRDIRTGDTLRIEVRRASDEEAASL